MRKSIKEIENENPELARIMRFEAHLKNFNKDYAEILEEDLLNVNEHLQALHESGEIFRQLGRL